MNGANFAARMRKAQYAKRKGRRAKSRREVMSGEKAEGGWYARSVLPIRWQRDMNPEPRNP
jgi:hypothetical protein